MNNNDLNSNQPRQEDDGPGNSPPVWNSEQLLQGNIEAVIEHQEEKYRLRLTRHGKLILYK